jgi:Domain of Unknown Function (DUF928)
MSGVSIPPPVAAKSIPSQRPRIRYKLLAPPPLGNPVATSGAGSRKPSGNCPTVKLPLTALVPPASSGDLVWGRTGQAQPTVWIYLPYTLTPDRPGELRLLQHSAAGALYTPIVRVTQATPGVMGIRLPANQTLIPNQLYYWSFVVLCDLKDASANQFVKAAIQRIEVPAQRPTRSSAPEQTAAFYAEQGLWYDALTQLGENRRAFPQNTRVADTWTDLLKDVGFERLASQPVVSTP